MKIPSVKQSILIGIILSIVLLVVLREYGAFECGTSSIASAGFSFLKPSYRNIRFSESGDLSWSFHVWKPDLTLVNASVSIVNTDFGPCKVPLENIQLPYKLTKDQEVEVTSTGCAPAGYHWAASNYLHMTMTFSRNGSLIIDDGVVRVYDCWTRGSTLY